MKSMLYPRASATRRVVDMSGMWGFQFDPKSQGLADGWNSALPSPMQMPVPAAFADFFTDQYSRDYTGDFWYETEFYVPREWSGMALSLRFSSAAHRATVFINGKEAGFHEGGFLPFSVAINEFVRFDAPNKVSVKVNNELGEEFIPVGRTTTLPDGTKLSKGYFDFFNYAGLLRPVKLVAVPTESISDFAVIHRVNGNDAEVDYTVTTNGSNSVTVTVFDEDGRQVAYSEGTSGTITIAGARLWNVLDAYLYKVVLRITDGETVVDEYIEDIGIRTVEIRGADILLNGKPVYLKGFGKHEESDIVGRAYNLGVFKRDFELMKWIGANSFRTSHYPYSEEMYQIADREGFLVVDETPAVGMMDSTMNFFAAAHGEQTTFFRRSTIPTLLKNCLDATEEMIARDKNHACVIAWSLLNEPETSDEASYPFLKAIFDRALELDPQKRPRTYASIMLSQPEQCKCYQLCDFISLNRYYGWYVMGGSDIATAEMGLRRELNSWKEKNLGIPFIFSEYGADTYASVHKLPGVMWSQEYQIDMYKMNHKVFDEFDFVRGEQVWACADFQTNDGIMRVDGNKKGIFTRQRQPKSAAFYLKERWDSLPLGYKSEK